MEVAVSTHIKARPEKVWALLTNAQDFPRWNSTLISVEGNIAAGETIRLKAKIAPKRTFKLRITTAEPNRLLIWEDGAAPMFKGVRRYTLTPKADGSTDFSMVETFSGLMLPMIAGSLPDFRPSFAQYAADLKAEAER
jgi:hypothetical protein